jgi:hypothetical protein
VENPEKARASMSSAPIKNSPVKDEIPKYCNMPDAAKAMIERRSIALAYLLKKFIVKVQVGKNE